MAMNNSLAEVRPELVPEWSEKNLPLKPDEITFGSNKKVWWRLRSLPIVRLGGSVRIVAESGTLLFLPVPVVVNARIAVGTYS